MDNKQIVQVLMVRPEKLQHKGKYILVELEDVNTMVGQGHKIASVRDRDKIRVQGG
jgi:hypothetical protein